MESRAPDIKRILCPIDFSDAAARVVDQAVAVAGWYKARILALHVYTPLVIPFPMGPATFENREATLIEQMRANTGTCFNAATAAGIDVDVAVDIGRPAAEILNRATTLPADMLVIGTHGGGGFEHLVLGSVAEKVIRKAPCPVLTVPPRASATAELPFRRVLCAVDFSESSIEGLNYACSLARESDATLTLLHVIEWPWTEPPAPTFEDLPAGQAAALKEFRRYLETGAKGRLDTVARADLRMGCTREPAVRHGKPYVEILRVAEEIHADLIVVGLHGRNAAGMTLFGSTTNQVVRRATCPVLTLKR